MKRLVYVFFCLLFSGFAYSQNKMSMVTYFPVPYVAYSQVDVAHQLDVGLTSTCNMNLGCTGSDTPNLNANEVNLNGGNLNLEGDRGVAGQLLTLGSGLNNAAGKIKFKDVRIQEGKMQSLNAGEANVQSLQLFNKPFPPCRGKGDGSGIMQWTKLKLQGYGGTDPQGELYLVCGGAPAEKPNCCSADFTGDFAACIKESYGINSAEYICASSGNPNPYFDQIGCASGGLICGIALNLGSKEEDLKKYGDVWFNGGFRRYACDGKPSYSTSGGGDDPTKYEYTWQLAPSEFCKEREGVSSCGPGGTTSSGGTGGPSIKYYRDCGDVLRTCNNNEYPGVSCTSMDQGKACIYMTGDYYCADNTKYKKGQKLECKRKQ